MSNKTVAYYYDEEVGNYNDVNLMRPHRVRLAHNLIDGYGLQNKMMVHRPERSLITDMTVFHADGAPPPPPPPNLHVDSAWVLCLLFVSVRVSRLQNCFHAPSPDDCDYTIAWVPRCPTCDA